jgi:hypothetical protein
MTLAEYLAEKAERGEGRGEMARLARDSKLDYSTVWKIAKREHRLTEYPKAKALSDATGGLVSVEELCEPTKATGIGPS